MSKIDHEAKLIKTGLGFEIELPNGSRHHLCYSDEVEEILDILWEHSPMPVEYWFAEELQPHQGYTE